MSAEMRDDSSTGQCPIHRQSWGERKTIRHQQAATSPVECDEYGTWHIHNFTEVRMVLRSGSTKQAGGGAEIFEKTAMGKPVIFLEGKEHQQYRKETARFFTPKAISSHYEQSIEQIVDRLIERIKREKQVNFSEMASLLVGSVVCTILGLTHSRLPGIQGRLDAYIDCVPGMEHVHGPLDKNPQNWLRWRPFQFLRVRWHTLLFVLLDVKPAVQACERQPEENMISHLLAQKYGIIQILMECTTFALGGIHTTRAFVCAAAWHLLEKPELRARYLAASDEEREAILQEILRVEPVAEILLRRATADIPLYVESINTHVTIPTGALIALHVSTANIDESVVGEEPLQIRPGRELTGGQVSSAVMSFGDGSHSCPGRFIAMRETDIFLRRLLALDGIHIVKEPDVCWTNLLMAYALPDFIVGIALDQRPKRSRLHNPLYTYAL